MVIITVIIEAAVDELEMHRLRVGEMDIIDRDRGLCLNAVPRQHHAPGSSSRH